MKKKTHAEFVEEIKDRAFTVIGKYETARKKIKFKCNTCDCIWESIPDSVSRGSGCPKCAKNAVNNIIANHGTWLEIDVSTKKCTNSIMKIDKIDYDFIKVCGYGKFTASKKRNNTEYVSARINGKKESIHRLVLHGAEILDHKNGDGLDNRFFNLRSVTSSQNSMNSKSKNRSGIRGATFCKNANTWRSSIMVNGVAKNLGRFKTKEDAGEAYKKASLELHGEYSYFNREEI